MSKQLHERCEIYNEVFSRDTFRCKFSYNDFKKVLHELMPIELKDNETLDEFTFRKLGAFRDQKIITLIEKSNIIFNDLQREQHFDSHVLKIGYIQDDIIKTDLDLRDKLLNYLKET